MPVETYKINIIEEGVEKDLTREDIVELLYNDVATVTFTKKDGSERVMECTLLQHILDKHTPKIENPDEIEEKVNEWVRSGVAEEDSEESKRKTENPNVVAVWDIPSDGWRSFRLDSIKSISIPTS
tara:strand:+ start:846 stop:1223 length:378 start_codon:yes stop_codon:yes gene_type:complete